MATEYACPDCGQDIVVHFVKPGELAKCQHCGAKSVVPGEVIETEKKVNREREVNIEKEAASDNKASKERKVLFEKNWFRKSKLWKSIILVYGSLGIARGTLYLCRKDLGESSVSVDTMLFIIIGFISEVIFVLSPIIVLYTRVRKGKMRIERIGGILIVLSQVPLLLFIYTKLLVGIGSVLVIPILMLTIIGIIVSVLKGFKFLVENDLIIGPCLIAVGVIIFLIGSFKLDNELVTGIGAGLNSLGVIILVIGWLREPSTERTKRTYRDDRTTSEKREDDERQKELTKQMLVDRWER